MRREGAPAVFDLARAPALLLVVCDSARNLLYQRPSLRQLDDVVAGGLPAELKTTAFDGGHMGVLASTPGLVPAARERARQVTDAWIRCRRFRLSGFIAPLARRLRPPAPGDGRFFFGQPHLPRFRRCPAACRDEHLSKPFSAALPGRQCSAPNWA